MIAIGNNRLREMFLQGGKITAIYKGSDKSINLLKFLFVEKRNVLLNADTYLEEDNEIDTNANWSIE